MTDVTFAPRPGELRHAAAQPRYHGSGRCSGGSLPRPAPPAVRPDDQQRASPYVLDRDHSDDGRGRGAGERRHETSYSRSVEPGDRPTYQCDDGDNYYQRRGRTDRSTEFVSGIQAGFADVEAGHVQRFSGVARNL